MPGRGIDRIKFLQNKLVAYREDIRKTKFIIFMIMRA